jgi:Raf kinase inhibitor-like YbhB/YbcL family protein
MTSWILGYMLPACLAGCGDGAGANDGREVPRHELGRDGNAQQVLSISSPAFAQDEKIPAKYAYHNDNLSLPLAWTEPPAGTVSMVLIVDDPDAPAGDWVHWLVYDLPPELRELPAGASGNEQPLANAKEGLNSYGNIGYDGPGPPRGQRHRYVVHLYAVKTSIGLESGAAKAEVLRAIAGKVLAEAQLTGTYER